MEIKENDRIIAFGQEAVVIQIEKICSRTFAYLDHSIVVPYPIYSRDYVEISEIQELL